MVLAELRHDGADLPVLGVVQARDLRLDLSPWKRPTPRRRFAGDAAISIS